MLLQFDDEKNCLVLTKGKAQLDNHPNAKLFLSQLAKDKCLWHGYFNIKFAAA